jgi:methionine-rich copper-binding protein CopC
VLVAIVPANGTVVRTSPSQILLRFHGRVDAPEGAVQLLDANGRPIELGGVARPAADAVEVPVARPLPRGTYTVLWHLFSTESHPVDGSSSFSVGARGPVGFRLLLLLCAGVAATLALPLGVAAGSTGRRAVVALGAVFVLAVPLARYAFAAKTKVPASNYFTTATKLGPLGLEVGVSPAAPGTNTIDLLVSDRTGRRVDLSGITVTAAHSRSRPLRFRTERLAPGHFTVDVARLAVPGSWNLRVDARRGSRSFRSTISLPIGS